MAAAGCERKTGAAERSPDRYAGGMDEPACPGCRALMIEVAALRAQGAHLSRRLCEALRARASARPASAALAGPLRAPPPRRNKAANPAPKTRAAPRPKPPPPVGLSDAGTYPD